MVIYITNKWAHFQGSVCRELARLLGPGNFKMLLMEPLDFGQEENETHKKMNWTHRPPQEEWIMQPAETVKELLSGEWLNLLRSAEVAIVGAMYGCRETISALDGRINAGKLTFIMNERYFKEKPRLRDFLNPRFLRLLQVLHRRFNNRNVHYLPIDYYGANDMRFLRACKGRMWKWAYFPEVSEKPTVKQLHDKLRVCWCGRMIECKRVEYIIKALGLVPDDAKCRMEVTIVGEGDTRKDMEALAEENGLSGVVSFKPFLSPSGVVEFLEGQDVYVFPSDRHEGWGVALQEAMDKCCVPIANTAAGATLCVVKDGVNGFTFTDGDVERIADRLVWLLEHPAERLEMGRRGWETMQEWSPRTGAERLVALIESIKSGNYGATPIEGLCSRVG